MKINALPTRASAATGQMLLGNVDYDERATMRAWEDFLADEPKCASDPVPTERKAVFSDIEP